MLASHNHTEYGTNREGYTHAGGDSGTALGSSSTDLTGSNGTHNHTFSGSSSHSHNITLNLKYINVIVCSKN